jgi:hypothetical protein
METIVRGRKINFSVDEKTGQFRASHEGVDYKGDTLAAIKAALELDLKKKPLSVRFVEVSEDYNGKVSILKGVITGKHSGNGNVLVKYDGEERTEQHGSWRGRGLLKGDTDVKKLEELRAARDHAEKEFNAFIAKSAIDTDKIVG